MCGRRSPPARRPRPPSPSGCRCGSRRRPGGRAVELLGGAGKLVDLDVAGAGDVAGLELDRRRTSIELGAAGRPARDPRRATRDGRSRPGRLPRRRSSRNMHYHLGAVRISTASSSDHEGAFSPHARSRDRRRRPQPDRARLQGLARPAPPRGDGRLRRRPAARAQPRRRSRSSSRTSTAAAACRRACRRSTSPGSSSLLSEQLAADDRPGRRSRATAPRRSTRSATRPTRSRPARAMPTSPPGSSSSAASTSAPSPPAPTTATRT